MKNKLAIFGIVILLSACSSTKQVTQYAQQTIKADNTFLITEISTDKTYGLSSKNPVEVGGVKDSEGPLNERRYLNALTGPNGASISYYRAQSCCPVKSENGFMGTALLDEYRVTWENSKDTVSIFINMYDSGKLMAPFGFEIKE